MSDFIYYCPACDQMYGTYALLIEHLKKAQSEGDQHHMDIIDLEEWNLASVDLPVDPDAKT